MSDQGKGRFTIREVTVCERGMTYQTHRITGWLDGRRVRKQFRDRNEALGEKTRLEVQAANAGEITARNTRLSALQLAEAEAAFARLGPRSLSLAVEWFLDTYRPPVTEMPLEAAETAFLADRRMHVRAVTLRDYKLTLTDFRAACGVKHVHEVKTSAVLAFLAGRNVGPKRWNNLRGDRQIDEKIRNLSQYLQDAARNDPQGRYGYLTAPERYELEQAQQEKRARALFRADVSRLGAEEALARRSAFEEDRFRSYIRPEDEARAVRQAADISQINQRLTKLLSPT